MKKLALSLALVVATIVGTVAFCTFTDTPAAAGCSNC